MATKLLHGSSRPRALKQWCAEEKKASFILVHVFFKKIFFISTMDLTAWSFDHSCRESKEMENRKLFFEKMKKAKCLSI
jgi:hypothetical protein